MKVSNQVVIQFLRSYLSISDSLGDAIHEYLNTEDENYISELSNSVKTLLTSEIGDDELKNLIQDEGNYSISGKYPNARDFLLDLFTLLQSPKIVNTRDKPYDIFISYSSKDKSTALRISKLLKNSGLSVWLDRFEIFVGHNIVDQVYKGIRSSQFLLVVLSKNSIKSKWVMEELSTAKIKEIESENVFILPALIEKCDIPDSLINKKYADLSVSFDEGIRNIVSSVFAYQAQIRVGKYPKFRYEISKTFADLVTYTKNNEDYLTRIDWPRSEGFKQCTISPPDGYEFNLDKRKLLDIVQASTVNLKNWGGAPFPYLLERQNLTINNYSKGIRVYDKEKWPNSDFSFTYYSFEDSGRFFYRTTLYEDHLIGWKGEGKIAENTLVLSWIIKDICSPLVFAKNLLFKLSILQELRISYKWEGMKDRMLIILSRNRTPFFRQYKCREPVIEFNVDINSQSDLVEMAVIHIMEIFWLFGWSPSDESQIRKETKSTIEGVFLS